MIRGYGTASIGGFHRDPQLRLRCLGGIILIDFIDMKNKHNQEEIVETLKRELAKDKAHTRIIGMTGLGFWR